MQPDICCANSQRKTCYSHIPPCSTSNGTNYLTVCFLMYKVVYKTTHLTTLVLFATLKAAVDNIGGKNVKEK